MKNVPIITIDGPSGSGKGTLCKLLADRLGYHLLDSGALYRLVALAAEHHGVSAENELAVADIAGCLDVQFKAHGDGVQVVLEGEDVSLSIRTETCGMNASKVASLTLVRKALQERQRAFAELPGLVADGRDMGTVIFPEAPVKVFLTASAQERADRRYKQLKSKGLSASLSDILTDIQKRDERDESRTVAPLKPSEDALVIDCTHMSILDVEQKILTFIHSKGVL
ncbi:(d)CMP kinase [Candidatus Njordibacter sp. Uisw_056]|jgi:cytidylate kinase|uniref:(d)CMP kinase n=1 Tax=Candidatus Njordibacter sp. Uisw_056 TaxID=3230973 RepID=UPI003D39B7AD|tara:strand:+ start:2580 stop:3257 length:678 start_codon:yes stop_codon:yes gene_type:complete